MNCEGQFDSSHPPCNIELKQPECPRKEALHWETESITRSIGGSDHTSTALRWWPCRHSTGAELAALVLGRIAG